MSFPRQVPPHSSSPTKSSLRRPSSIGGPTLLPSPRFEDDPIVAAHQSPRQTSTLFAEDPGIEGSEHAVGDDSLVQYPGDAADRATEASFLPASFQPFFTLVEDSVSSEHYHPTVHYIFEDDDADIIAEAACRSLEILDPSQRIDTSQTRSQSGPAEAEVQTRLPPPIPGVHEHYLTLDVLPRFTNPQYSTSQQAPATAQGSSPGGPSTLAPFFVTSAHSLSAEWQVLQTKVTAAPTIGDGDEEEDEGLMLRIEGRGNTPAATQAEKERERDAARETMEEMIDRFQRRMDEIKQLLDTGVGEE